MTWGKRFYPMAFNARMGAILGLVGVCVRTMPGDFFNSEQPGRSRLHVDRHEHLTADDMQIIADGLARALRLIKIMISSRGQGSEVRSVKS
jgi:hypothetical protein